MATSTTNLGLTKPAGTDKIRIAQINGNMDILDEKIGAVGNTSLQAQVTSQNEAISNRVIKLDLGASTTSNNPMAVLQENFASMEVGVSYTGKIITTMYAWSYTGLKHAASYGVFHCWTYASAVAPQIVRNYNGTWSSEELALKIDLNPIETTITRNKTPTRADVLKCFKSGYTCTLTFNNVSYGESFSTDTAIATLYSLRPQSLTRFVLHDGNKNPYLCYIDVYGNVLINGYTSGALLYGTVTFIATT